MPPRRKKEETAVVETAVVETPEVPAVVKTEVPKLPSAYLETLKRVSELGGKEGKEVALATLEADRRESGRAISSATLLTHLYRMRSGKKGCPRLLANSKTGGRSNDNERFILLPEGFAVLGIPVSAALAGYEITEKGFSPKS